MAAAGSARAWQTRPRHSARVSPWAVFWGFTTGPRECSAAVPTHVTGRAWPRLLHSGLGEASHPLPATLAPCADVSPLALVLTPRTEGLPPGSTAAGDTGTGRPAASRDWSSEEERGRSGLSRAGRPLQSSAGRSAPALPSGGRQRQRPQPHLLPRSTLQCPHSSPWPPGVCRREPGPC